jgi:hypothetical protein
MTVLSSKEGKFYDVPDDILNKHQLPAERVKELFAEFDGEKGAPVAPSVAIYVTGEGAYIEPSAASNGDVEPYAHHHGHHGHGHHGGWGGGWGPGPGFFPPPWVFRRRYWW